MVSFFPRNTAERNKASKKNIKEKKRRKSLVWFYYQNANSLCLWHHSPNSKWYSCVSHELLQFTRTFSQFLSQEVYMDKKPLTYTSSPTGISGTENFFPFWTKPHPLPRGSFSSFHTKFSLKVLVSFFVYHDWFLTRISIFYFISHYTVKPFQTCVPSFRRLIRIHCSYCCETCGSYMESV